MGCAIDTISMDDFVRKVSWWKGFRMSESNLIEHVAQLGDAHTSQLATRVGTELPKSKRDALYLEDVRYNMEELGMSREDAIANAQSIWNRNCKSIAGEGYPSVE
jgi:hypothetical protein